MKTYIEKTFNKDYIKQINLFGLVNDNFRDFDNNFELTLEKLMNTNKYHHFLKLDFKNNKKQKNRLNNYKIDCYFDCFEQDENAANLFAIGSSKTGKYLKLRQLEVSNVFEYKHDYITIIVGLTENEYKHFDKNIEDYLLFNEYAQTVLTKIIDFD